MIFGSVWFLYKKSNETKIFLKKQKTKTKPKPVQTDHFRFGLVRVFRKKWFKPVWLGFGPVWLGFF